MPSEAKLHAYDSDDGKWRYFVAAPTMKVAAKILSTSPYSMRLYGNGRMDSGHPGAALALAHVGTVFRQLIAFTRDAKPIEPCRTFDPAEYGWVPDSPAS